MHTKFFKPSDEIEEEKKKSLMEIDKAIESAAKTEEQKLREKGRERGFSEEEIDNFIAQAVAQTKDQKHEEFEKKLNEAFAKKSQRA